MSQSDDQNELDQDLDDLKDLGGDDADQSLDALFGGGDDESKIDPPRNRDLSMFSNIPVRLTLEVDSVEIMLGDLINLTPGEVLPLDKKTGEPLDVRVNGQLLARAEVVVVDGQYGLRLTEIVQDITVPGARK